jgi:hypothetical protein
VNAPVLLPHIKLPPHPIEHRAPHALQQACLLLLFGLLGPDDEHDEAFLVAPGGGGEVGEVVPDERAEGGFVLVGVL